MGLSGYVGSGAIKGLEDILTEQMLKAKMAEEQRQAQAQEAIQQQRLTQDQQQHGDMMGHYAKQDDRAESARRDANNRAGVADMMAQREVMDEQEARAAQESAWAGVEADPNISPRVKQAGKLQRVGIKNIGPDDLKTPDDLKADEDAYIRKMGGAADAQARAAARYREPKPTGPGGLQPGQLTTAKQFQDDYARDSKTYITTRNAYQQVASAAKVPDAAGDLSLIFGYMKMLDPNSVVRETEFANAQNAAGVPDQIRNLYNRAMNGERLNPNQRQQFVGQARRIMQNAQTNQSRVRETYGSRASKFGIDPTMVLDSEEQLDMGDSPAAPAAPTTAPTVERVWNPATGKLEPK